MSLFKKTVRDEVLGLTRAAVKAGEAVYVDRTSNFGQLRGGSRRRRPRSARSRYASRRRKGLQGSHRNGETGVEVAVVTREELIAKLDETISASALRYDVAPDASEF